MPDVSRNRCLSTSLVLATAFALLVTTPATAQRINLGDYPKTDVKELPERYRHRLEAEVGWIITEEERDVFLRLDSDIKRDLFIKRFWEVRDPTPGTPRNEYKELHYERLAYANKFFGRGTTREGWQTDRGRIWILLGEPLSRNRVQDDMLVYPAEVWMYSGEPELGLPPFFYVMFYQRFGSGEYRLYSPLSDGPDKLLNGAGQQEVYNRLNQPAYQQNTYAPTGFGDVTAIYSILREIDFDLASAAFSLFPSEAGLEFGISPLRSEMLLGQIANVPEMILTDKTWAYNVLTGVAESDVRFETLDMDARAVPLIDVDGEPFIHFATVTEGEELNIDEYEDHFYFSFEASGSITTDAHKVLTNFEQNLSGELEDQEQARRFSRQPFLYLDMVPTLPGHQTFTIMLQNKVAHTFGQKTIALDVPAIHPQRPRLLGPLLALTAREVPDYDPYAERFPFQYANVAMVPAVDGRFALGQPLLAFQQVLLPAGYDRPVTTRYALRNEAGVVVREGTQEFRPEEADVYGVIPHLWTIASEGLAAGRYALELVLEGENQLALRQELEIVPAERVTGRPFINAQPAPPAADVSVALERARQYRAVGDLERAIEWLSKALEREPDNTDARTLQVELLEAAGRWQDLIELLTPVVVDNPRDVDTMLELARAHTEVGETYDAIRYYERSRLVMGEDKPEILNALASAYHAEGKTDKAIELLRRSLELDAEQAEVRRMLDRLTQPVAEPQR